MLTRAGAKLLDFGLAKSSAAVVASATASTFAPATPNLTFEGAILGTFQYMAPEQIEGREADARSDIFAFGAVLYEMVTGSRAFSGKTHASLISSILKDEPRPVTELQPLTPPLLDHIVSRCLAKDPDERWQDAGDLTRELLWISHTGLLGRGTAPAVASGTVRGRTMLGIGAALAGLIVGAAATAMVIGLVNRQLRRTAGEHRALRRQHHAGRTSAGHRDRSHHQRRTSEPHLDGVVARRTNDRVQRRPGRPAAALHAGQWIS